VASLLGRPDPAREAGIPEAGDRVALRRWAEAPPRDAGADPGTVPAGGAFAASTPPFPASARVTAAVRAQRPDVLPPTLAKSFPAEALPASARWGVSMGIGLPGAGIADQARRVHKIVNGDSLPSLAKRYLGNEDRAGEIFEANRDVLSSPDALPIGVELRIPPRDARKSAAKPSPNPPLVPIRPRGSP